MCAALIPFALARCWLLYTVPQAQLDINRYSTSPHIPERIRSTRSTLEMEQRSWRQEVENLTTRMPPLAFTPSQWMPAMTSVSIPTLWVRAGLIQGKWWFWVAQRLERLALDPKILGSNPSQVELSLREWGPHVISNSYQLNKTQP